MKRAFDISVALALLVLTAPLLLFAVLLVLATCGRPVFFGHHRLGRGGAAFRCWKLRTMERDAERVLRATPVLHSTYVTNGYKLPLSADPRLTPVGPFLRRTYLDELPQIFNVLNGTMSIVGPRPVVPEEIENYAPHAAELLASKPGLFGAWTAHGRARPPYPQRASIELDYVRHRSLLLDLSIIARSIPVILIGQAPDG